MKTVALEAYEARVPTMLNIEELACDFVNRPLNNYRNRSFVLKDGAWDRLRLHLCGRGPSKPWVGRH